MRPFLTFILLLLILSCKQKEPAKPLTTVDLKYAAYSWNRGADSFGFYLAHYLHIDENGHFIAMRHDQYMGKALYFAGEIQDSLKIRINKTLSNNYPAENYLMAPEDDFIYDGFTYCFDYKKSDSVQHKIQFVPDKCPEQIKQLSLYLDTLVFSPAVKKIDSFNTDGYKNELIKFSLQSALPFPEPVKQKPALKK